MSLKRGVSVVTSDGEEVGKVHDVVADEDKDIFSGIALRHGLLGSELFVPADLVEDMTNDRVLLTIPASETDERLKPYEG